VQHYRATWAGVLYTVDVCINTCRRYVPAAAGRVIQHDPAGR